MGITGLIPFIEKASRKVNVDEFRGCTVAVDSYCWLHKGAFACAETLVRGEDTDVHIRYCLKYVTMLLAKNIKPILVFDGRHLPAKAQTELKRRESRNISKKRAAELLSLGQIEEARSYMRRSVDITHEMALKLIQECRKRNVDCIVAPYEADAQLAYLNVKNIAHLVITEDSDLILFGCTKVLFKMDLDGAGTLVETAKLPLVMKCPIERYTFDKFRQMCIMSGCDYLPSLPGIGLAKARQFITATHDPNIANALRKLPSYFHKMSLSVTDEYRENFLKAEATFKHQYVYDPINRQMVRLNEPDDEDIETALCVNAGELLDAKTAFQLALGNIDPFTLKVMDDWHPDDRKFETENIKTNNWTEKSIAPHPSIWSKEYEQYLGEPCPWKKKPQPKKEAIIQAPKTRAVKKIVNMVPKYVPETQDQDQSLSIETLSSMYCVEPQSKKQKVKSDDNITEELSQSFESHNNALTDTEITKELTQTQKETSPILSNKERSFNKSLRNGKLDILKRLSKFPRTVVDDNVVESKFFNPNVDFKCEKEESEKDLNKSITIEESPERVRVSKNPFRVKSVSDINQTVDKEIERIDFDQGIKPLDMDCDEIPDTYTFTSSLKENSRSPIKERSPILESKISKNHFKLRMENSTQSLSEDSVVENTYPMEKLLTPLDSQESFGLSQASQPYKKQDLPSSQPMRTTNGYKKPTCRVPGLKRTTSLPSNQPTLLSMFGFQKKPVLKR